jgi:hypothetical protein
VAAESVARRTAALAGHSTKGTHVAEPIPAEALRNSLLLLLEEIMEQVHNFVLDEGTSMFETLAEVTAEEASRPLSERNASLAAQVNHVRFYIDALLEQQQNADWDGSWRVGPVNDAEWQELIERLRASSGKAKHFMQTFEQWDERYIGGAIALIAHSAYHHGEILTSLGILRSRT